MKDKAITLRHECVTSTMTMQFIDCEEKGHVCCMFCQDCKFYFHVDKRVA